MSGGGKLDGRPGRPVVTRLRIALANLPFPETPDESVRAAEDAIARAGEQGAHVVCFPECFVPGYRGVGKSIPPPDPAFLERAWSDVARAAATADLAVVLGTERVVDGGLRISALVVNRDGTIAGFQDKVQLDPSEEATYAPGFETARLRVGPALVRCRHLPRGLALSRDGALGRPPRRARRVPPALPRGRARRLPADCGSPIPRTPSTRRPPCVAPPRTPATSPR